MKFKGKMLLVSTGVLSTFVIAPMISQYAYNQKIDNTKKEMKKIEQQKKFFYF